MTYVEGFVTPVTTANHAAYRAHAEAATALLKEFGAARLMEAWGDDVPTGKITDFARAVQANADETAVFSWIEYPDKATRDAAVARMMTDPRMEAMGATMPFDGGRMIYAGFAAELDEGASRHGGGATGYVDGFVVPVAEADKAAYFDMAREASAVFRDHGALRVVEAWGDDVAHGKVTDFHRAVLSEDGETVVFSWIEWPSKVVRDAGMAAAMADDRMKTPPADMPFDGKRLIYGGFAPLLDA